MVSLGNAKSIILAVVILVAVVAVWRSAPGIQSSLGTLGGGVTQSLTAAGGGISGFFGRLGGAIGDQIIAAFNPLAGLPAVPDPSTTSPGPYINPPAPDQITPAPQQPPPVTFTPQPQPPPSELGLNVPPIPDLTGTSPATNPSLYLQGTGRPNTGTVSPAETVRVLRSLTLAQRNQLNRLPKADRNKLIAELAGGRSGRGVIV